MKTTENFDTVPESTHTVANRGFDFIKQLETLHASREFKIYIEVRDAILKLLGQGKKTTSAASSYWDEELAGFEYMLDASPLIIQKLREHCFHLTGLRSQDYRGHHSNWASIYKRKLESLKALDDRQLFVPEARDLGGFGHEIDGNLVNLDTLKFFECLIALNKSGILKKFGSDKKRATVLEIGAGWGGFAYQFKKLQPNSTYVIIDLPATMLFSAVYLRTLFPNARTAICDADTIDGVLDQLDSFDFVFIPHYLWDKFRPKKLDLAINMVSFQEMTTAQVTSYLQGCVNIGCESFYSMNRNRSPFNKEMSSVSELIMDFYDTKELHLMESTYVDLPVSLVSGGKAKLLESIKTLARRKLLQPEFRYRHIIGTARAPTT